MFFMCAEKILNAKIKIFCSILLTAAVALLVYAVIRQVWFSLTWQIANDLPIMLYDGLLINDFGRMPYRDFFEMNPPGTMALYAALQHIIQSNSLHARILDITILIFISFCTCLTLWSHGLRSGLVASAVFACAYMNAGFEHALQREYLCIVPLALSMAIACNAHTLSRPVYIYFVLIGALAGLAFSIKPPLILCWLPIAAYFAVQKINAVQSGKSVFKTIGPMMLCTLAGALLVPMALLAWLYTSNALGPFWSMAVQYWPLYTQLTCTGDIWAHDTMAVLNRYWFNTVLSTDVFWNGAKALRNLDRLSFMGLLSTIFILKDKIFYKQVIAVWMLVFLTFLYIPYVGKFWIYHYIPLFYALSLSAGLLVSKKFLQKIDFSPCASILIASAILGCVPFQAIQEWKHWKLPESSGATKNSDIDFIESYLNEHAAPNDLIMPLEVADGAIQVLYRLKRPLAGKFIYDFHFYHHPENPYIQALRAQVMADLRELKPKFIVRSKNPWRSPAVNLSWKFAELDAFIAAHYSPVTDNSRGLQVLTLIQK
jgi:hypothetical protein